MRQLHIVAIAVACVFTMSLDGEAQVQQSRQNALQDSARFRSAEWEVVPIVRLDSSKTADTMAVRDIRSVHWLGPSRLVYQGRLARGGKWALFGVVDGVTKRLMVSGEEFREPDGRKTKIDLRYSRVVAGPGSIAVVANIDSRSPNAILASDGATWRRVLMVKDTLTLDGKPITVDGFALREVAPDGALHLSILAKAQNVSGMVRLTGNVLERLLLQGDSIAGVEPFDFDYQLRGGFGLSGLPTGVRVFKPLSGGGWVAIVRRNQGSGRYVEHILTSVGQAPRELMRTKPFGSRQSHDSIGFIAVSPTGEVLLERGAEIGLVGADGAWRPLLGPADIRHNEGYRLGDVAWLDQRSSRAILSVWLLRTSVSSSTSGISVMRTRSLWPKLFYFDGSGATEVRADTTVRADAAFVSWDPSPIASNVPGYDEGVIVDQRLSATGTTAAMFFDTERRTFVPAPAFRTTVGDIGLESLIAWNNDNEAIVRHAGGLALLRRQ
jgi:hypothetical protein